MLWAGGQGRMTNVTDNSCQLLYRDSSDDERGGKEGIAFDCLKHVCICINSNKFMECQKILQLN